jgi:hypothetical protein
MEKKKGRELGDVEAEVEAEGARDRGRVRQR